MNEPRISEDFVSCTICGKQGRDLTSHVSRIHKISAKEYSQKHPLKCDSINRASSDRMKGSKNPAFQHGGRLSPFSKKFVKGDVSAQTAKKAAETRAENGNTSTTLEYWMKHANGDEALAEQMLRDRQTTFSLQKCIEKHGEEEGTRIWQARQEKWMKNFKKQNYSTISQKMFHSIMTKFQSENIYFATWDREDMIDYKNKEYRLRLKDGKMVLPDFIDLKQKKIIEFDGTYWHSQTIANPKREKEREEYILKSGYQLLRISEADYKSDPNSCLQRCIDFLTE